MIKFWIWIMIVSTIILIPLASYIDWWALGFHEFKTYSFICIWETILIWLGFWCGWFAKKVERYKNA